VQVVSIVRSVREPEAPDLRLRAVPWNERGLGLGGGGATRLAGAERRG